MYSDGASLVVVEEREDAHNAFAGVLVAQLRGDGVQELFEVDAARIVFMVQIRDHLIDGRVFIFEPC